MVWSHDELDARLRAYWLAANTRGNRLLKIFFSILGVAFLSVVLLVFFCVAKFYVAISLGFALIAFIALAIYIIATANAFHKAHGVFCPYCGKSLLALGETLEDAHQLGVPKPETLECPTCRRTVVKS